MKFKAIIYDFDGVICDSVNVKTEAFAELYSAYGQDIQQQVVQYHLAHGGISRFEKVRHYHTNLLNIPITDEEVIDWADQFASLVKEKVIKSSYIKGADTFIKKYSNQYPQFICTGTPESEIIEILGRREIQQYFKGVYGSPKDKKTIIEIILKHHFFESDEMIYFGDALTDYHAAKTFNMRFIGVKSPDTIFPTDVTTIDDFEDLQIETLVI